MHGGYRQLLRSSGVVVAQYFARFEETTSDEGRLLFIA